MKDNIGFLGTEVRQGIERLHKINSCIPYTKMQFTAECLQHEQTGCSITNLLRPVHWIF
jgi:hypothetical protein